MRFAALIIIGLGCTLLSSAVGCRTLRPAPVSASAETTLGVHYSPQENLEAIDHQLFASATRSIDLAAYTLTDEYLARDLSDAASRGVTIRIYLDKGQTRSELTRESSYPRERVVPEGANGGHPNGVIGLLAGHSNVEIRVKRSGTLMHLKSYLVDHELLRSGSSNFSPTSEKRQDNDLTLTRDPESIRRFADKFEAVWTRPDNVPLTSPAD